jgi:hypothetical protein
VYKEVKTKKERKRKDWLRLREPDVHHGGFCKLVTG